VAIVAHPKAEHVYGALNLYRGRIYAGYADEPRRRPKPAPRSIWIT